MDNEYLDIRVDGRVLNRVLNPAVVFDTSIMRRVKIGEFDDMFMYWQVATESYRSAGFGEMADSLVVFELPNTQEALDNMMDHDGYYGKIYYEMHLNGEFS